MLYSESIRLRPLSRADLPLFEAWTNDLNFESEYNFFGLERPDVLAANFDARDGYLSAYSGKFVITLLDNTVIGDIGYHQQRYGPNTASIAYNIGLSIHADYRGHGYGTQAQKLLADYLFATYLVQRVEASTDITNRAEQRSLEKAGFTRDGILRQAQWRNGSWHDLVVYSKLRGEA
ncbi:MAG TPA: GNAT family protein [Ktedonobacteraceae bacterium]|jgi:aminoglycoside 6'-N-acetyltransferase|nr:GNAT family protein [Ktedonobacteraceae bacterium]